MRSPRHPLLVCLREGVLKETTPELGHAERIGAARIERHSRQMYRCKGAGV